MTANQCYKMSFLMRMLPLLRTIFSHYLPLSLDILLLLTKHDVKMAGYCWPSSLIACLWTETLPRSIKKEEKQKGKKKKETRPIYIQPSCPNKLVQSGKKFIIWDKGQICPFGSQRNNVLMSQI